MTETARVLDQLSRAFDGDAWCGPSLLGALDGLAAGPATAHPWPGTHSIHEIVRHLTTWTRTVAQRVGQRAYAPAAGEDWPAVSAGADETAWQASLGALRQSHAQLLTATAQLRADELDLVLSQPDGTDVSLYGLLHGTAQHYLYHTGQVALLRKYA